MPVKSCNKDSKPGWKWGDSGHCYTYTPGDKSSSKRARNKAIKQGRAIQVNKASSGIQSLRFDKKKFNRQQAVSWAKSHGFKSGDVEEMPNEWRLRQFPPGKCLRSGGMKDLSPGVRGYICPTASAIKKTMEEIRLTLDLLKSKL